MINKNRSSTFNTTIKRNSSLSTLPKQILVSLFVIFVTVNLLVVLFNLLLTILGSA